MFCSLHNTSLSPFSIVRVLPRWSSAAYSARGGQPVALGNSILTSQWGKIKISFSLLLALSSTSLFSLLPHLLPGVYLRSALAEKKRAVTSLENE